MKTVFVDTSGFYACLDRTDPFHPQALAAFERAEQEGWTLITTNYVTHETQSDGRVEIYNLDSNLYYRFVNYFGSGVYFHRNHHVNPTFFNPQLGKSASRWMR